MSLHPLPVPPVPDETARVAHAAFPHGNLYLRMRHTGGSRFDDRLFAPLFPVRGPPAAAPWRLALVTIFQFVAGLSDQQAADAVRWRSSWNYALRLDLTDAGFDNSVLCAFRTRLRTHAAQELLLDTMLSYVRDQGLLKPRGPQRTDSSYVLTAARRPNRLACVNETVRYALNTLATVAPDWLLPWVPPPWFERSGWRTDGFRLPTSRGDRQVLAETLGADGFPVLQAVYHPTAPHWLRELPTIQALRRIWLQH
jgi:transposase